MTSARRHYALAAALAVATVVALVLGIGALGIVGEGGPPDRIFLAVPVVLLVAALFARFRATGMVVALLVTAVAQVTVAAVAIVAVSAEVEDFAGASIADIVMVNAFYAAGFVVSAWLYRRAAGQPVGHGSAHELHA